MRAVLCVDVEPDRRATEVPGPASWEGAESILRDDAWLRAAMGGRRPVINWFVRIDHQIALSNGSDTWAAEHYFDRLTERSRVGDQVGVHPHNWRWGGESWVADASDDWMVDVTLGALDGFRTVFGSPCQTFRFGDRVMSTAVIGALIEDPDVLVDLTLEPGAPTIRQHVASEMSTAPIRHVDVAMSRPYRPCGDAIDLAMNADGRLTMVPLTTGAIPGSGEVDTLQLWRAPEQFERMLRLRLLDPDLTHLAFAVRTELFLDESASAFAVRNLQRLRCVLPDLEWVRSTELALDAGSPPRSGLGVVGALADELDGALDVLAPTGIGSGPGVIVDRVRGLVERESATVQRLHAAAVEIDGLRASVDRLGAQVELQQAVIARLEGDRSELESTVSWRVRARLIPFVRPMLMRLRRAG